MILKLDGRKVADNILKNLKEKIKLNPEILDKKLGIILLGENPASLKYIQMKKKACEKLAINVEILETKNINEVKKTILDWNDNETIGGFFIQLPLPDEFKSQTQKILNLIDPKKDIDGLTIETLGNLVVSKNIENKIKPATVEAVLQILKYYKIPVKGENICIIGSSSLVGMPLQICLNKMGATTTLCHEFTKNLKKNFKNKSVIISAVGKKNLINLKDVEPSTVLIDVGVSVENEKIYGDATWNDQIIQQNSLKITPPIGGVGPVTIACLIQNFINSIHEKTF